MTCNRSGRWLTTLQLLMLLNGACFLMRLQLESRETASSVRAMINQNLGLAATGHVGKIENRWS